ncbi:Com family DNA-binding transcriptional regulator [Pseudomonas antarctica]|nr:Com family DNA-binding transcriptional regulator [Pseudomonas antarctica]
MLKEFRCGNCNRLLARTGGFTHITSLGICPGFLDGSLIYCRLQRRREP